MVACFISSDATDFTGRLPNLSVSRSRMASRSLREIEGVLRVNLLSVCKETKNNPIPNDKCVPD